jgi:hypothetical protein
VVTLVTVGHGTLAAEDLARVLGEAGVEHLFHDGRVTPHHPTPEARLDGRRVVYDGGETTLPLREST